MAKKYNLERFKYEVAQEFGLAHRKNHKKSSQKGPDKAN